MKLFSIQTSNLSYTKWKPEKKIFWLWKVFYQSNYLKFILYRTRNEFHLWICFRERYNDMVYSILLHTRYYIHGSRAVKKTRPNPVSLGILNIMLPLPIIVPIHTCLFLLNRYRLMKNAKRKRKKRRIPLGMKLYHLYPV